MKAFLASAIAAVAMANSNADDVTGIFGDSDQWRTGYVTVDNHKDDLFYWLFESKQNPSTDPLVMWLTGGPGCASEVALFYENGPYQFNPDGSLKQNPFSWNNISNLLYVDQPIGTGFSHGGVFDVRNEDQVAQDLANLLAGFLEQNPEFVGRDFYITGESYAGHYVPAITYHLLNMENPPQLNVKGMAIGNGLTDPFQQYPAYAKFSYENNLISKEWDDVLKVGFKACQALILESQHGPKSGPKVQLATLEFCQLIAETVLGNPLKPKFNVYDIRIPCENPPLCYDFSPMDTFLNRADVQQALGVDKHWAEVDQMVHTYLLGDWMTNLVFKVGSILDNHDVQVLVYSGDKDWICNWRGGEAWTLSTHWNSHAEFNQQGFEMWNVDSQPAGEMR